MVFRKVWIREYCIYVLLLANASPSLGVVRSSALPFVHPDRFKMPILTAAFVLPIFIFTKTPLHNKQCAKLNLIKVWSLPPSLYTCTHFSVEHFAHVGSCKSDFVRFIEQSLWKALFQVATGKMSTTHALKEAITTILETHSSLPSSPNETYVLPQWIPPHIR